jgi:hypothetical protein
MEAGAGGFDLENFSFFKVNDDVAAAVGVGGVDPVKGGAALVFPLLVDALFERE